MIDFRDYTTYRLTDIAEIGRPGKDTVYPAGTVYIQVSASNGQVGRLKKPGTIEGKYVAVRPRIAIVPEYLELAIKEAMPRFRARYQSTINIQVDSFQYFDVPIHSSTETQLAAIALMEKADEAIQAEEKIVHTLKEEKRYYLDAMMADVD